MGRHLTGSIHQTEAKTWRVSIPTQRGSKSRKTRTFDTRAQAKVWLDSSVKELKNTEKASPNVSERKPQKSANCSTGGTLLENVSNDWLNLHFRRLQRAQRSRETSATFAIKQFLGYAKSQEWKSGADVTYSGFLEYFEYLANMNSAPEILHLASKISRPFKNGHGYDGDVLRNRFQDIVRMLDYGQVSGNWTLDFKPSTVTLPNVVRDIEGDIRRAVTWQECVLIAQELHVVHQFTMWLLRIFGLRISEAYGVLVRDVNYLGDEMTISIKRQGGGGQYIRNESLDWEEVITRDETKTRQGRRVLIVPRSLVPLIEKIIEVFHTNEDESVQYDHPLIPGLREINKPKKAGFEHALKNAAGFHRIDLSFDNSVSKDLATHDFRKAINTDLSALDVSVDARSAWLGHASGNTVNERSYIVKDKALRLERLVASKIDELITCEVPEGLMIPTRRRCTERIHKALHIDAHHIDTSLIEAGWLVDEASAQDALLVEDISRLTGYSHNQIERWFRDDLLERVYIRRPGCKEKVGAKSEEVFQLVEVLSQLSTIDDIAKELDRPYEQVWRWTKNLKITPIERGRLLFIDMAGQEKLRENAKREDCILEETMSLSEVAKTLNLSNSMVTLLLKNGILLVHPEQLLRPGRRIYRTSLPETDVIERGRSKKGAKATSHLS